VFSPPLPRAAARLLDRFLLTSWRAVVEMVDDRGHRAAAQIAFFAALSAIPVALLLTASFGLVFEPVEIRGRVIDTVFDFVPLAGEGDRGSLERTVSESLAAAGSLGVVSIVVLVASVTSAMSALRYAINVAWDIHRNPPLVRRKLLDLVLVLGMTGLLLVSFSTSAARRAAELLDDEAAVGSVAAVLLAGVGELVPYVFTGAVILFLYRTLPLDRPKVREIWPGALVATLLLAMVKGLLELYFEQLADFGALYGSLGALMALLLFLFGASLVLVFGAEFASEWSRLPSDEECERVVRGGRARVVGLVRRGRRGGDRA
jgi:membrane protein